MQADLRRTRQAVSVHRGHVHHRGRAGRQFLQAGRDPPGARVGAEVGVDVIRVIGGRHALIAGDDVAGGRVASLRHGLERDAALPFVLAVPAGHRGPGIGHGTDGNAPAVAVAELAVHVGVDEVVDRLRPGPQRFLGLVRRARPQQVVQRVGPRRAAVGAGMAEGEAVSGVRVAGDDRAVAGRHHVQGFRPGAAWLQNLVGDLGGTPIVLPGVFQRAVTAAKAFDEEVLVVRVAVCHAPGDVIVVAEVRRARNAGQGVAADAERRTGHVHLIVDVRRIEGAVRIPRQQRQAGGRAIAGNDPGVAARVHLAQPVAGGGRGSQLVEARQRRTRVRLAWRHGHQAALRIPLEQRRGPLGAQPEGQPQAPQLHLERSHQHVADLVHRQTVPRLPRLRDGLQQGIFDRQGAAAGQEGVHPVAVRRQHVARRVARHL